MKLYSALNSLENFRRKNGLSTRGVNALIRVYEEQRRDIKLSDFEGDIHPKSWTDLLGKRYNRNLVDFSEDESTPNPGKRVSYLRLTPDGQQEIGNIVKEFPGTH